MKKYATTIARITHSSVVRIVVVCGTPIIVLVPRVMELVCWMKTFMATRIASVAMPAATPTSRTMGMPNTIATMSAATPPASVPSSAFNWVGKTRSLRKCGIERNVNCLIAVGIVSSADV